jgi:hypothetical protein
LFFFIVTGSRGRKIGLFVRGRAFGPLHLAEFHDSEYNRNQHKAEYGNSGH